MKLILTPENIKKYVEGKFGDASSFQTLYDALINNSDPTISGFVNFVHTKLNDVRIGTIKNQNKFQVWVQEYARAIGLSPNNLRKFYAPVTDEVTITTHFYNEKTGEIESRTRVELHLLNEFNTDYIKEGSLYRAEIRKAEASNDETLISDAKAAYQKWLTENFEQEYVQEYYEAKAILDEHGGIAKRARKDIWEQINAIKLTKAAGEDYTTAQIDELNRLNRKRKQLGSTVDVLGNPKRGDDLLIAETIQKYNKAIAEFMDYKPESDDFEKAVKLKKAELGDGTSEYNEWYENNTRRIINNAFFVRRKEISRQINLYAGRGASKLSLDQLWNKIKDTTTGYRDEDGIFIGDDFSSEAKAKIKEYQEEIEDIKSTIAGTDGLSKKINIEDKKSITI